MNDLFMKFKHDIKLNDRLKTFVYIQNDKKYRHHTEAQIVEDIKEIYKGKMNRELDINGPKTFTEKIQWLKLFDSTAEKTALADKFLARDWVGKILGEEYLVPLLGVWDKWSDIRWDELPNSFCLKMNHGSAMNYVVTNKNNADIKKIESKFSLWIKRPFYAASLELHYKDIPRKIIAEKYIEEMNGNLYDYKFHCFNGQPMFIQCIGNRDLKNHTGYQNNFDLQWNKLDWIFEDYPEFPYSVEKPQKLDEMIDCASKLAKGFSYVRVDLYEIKDKVYFGEMTFTPASGIYPYKGSWNEKVDLKLGDMIILPNKKQFLNYSL